LIAKEYGFYGRRFEQVDAAAADAWRRRITGWARFNAAGAEAEASS
jgi:hypothetical protein